MIATLGTTSATASTTLRLMDRSRNASQPSNSEKKGAQAATGDTTTRSPHKSAVFRDRMATP